MDALFDLDAVARREDDNATPPSTPVVKAAKGATAATSKPINYWVRGIFRFGDAERTRTARAVGMSTHLDDDIARFVRYLTEEGFHFAERRAVLVQVLGVGNDDGVQIALSRDREGNRK